VVGAAEEVIPSIWETAPTTPGKQLLPPPTNFLITIVSLKNKLTAHFFFKHFSASTVV
jgi:hypothetical protein